MKKNRNFLCATGVRFLGKVYKLHEFVRIGCKQWHTLVISL